MQIMSATQLDTLNQRIAEHKNSAIGKHLLEAHGDKSLLNESQFRILRKYQGKFDCLVYEMLSKKERNPSLNTQTDSIRAKLFVLFQHFNTSIELLFWLTIYTFLSTFILTW